MEYPIEFNFLEWEVNSMCTRRMEFKFPQLLSILLAIYMNGIFAKQCANAVDFQFKRVDKSVNQKRARTTNTAVTEHFHLPKFSMSVINISHTAIIIHTDY